MVTTSLVPDGATQANGGTLYISPAPTSVIVDFSQPVNEATVQATDLVLSGSDISSVSPVKVTSVSWIDNHTAQFNLTGQLNPIGTINRLAGLTASPAAPARPSPPTVTRLS